MAKTSAKSKGYRKQKQKKPFLTKKEMIAAIVIVVIFIAAMIVVLNDDVLFYIFPDGNLAARDVREGDIVSVASKDLKTRFVKIGEIGELDGFTCTPSLSNLNVPTSYSFAPDDEGSNVAYVTVSGSAVNAEVLPTSYRDTMAGLGATVEFTDVVETTVQDHKAYVFSYTNSYYDSSRDADADGAEASEASEEKPANTFQQNFSAYIDADGSHTLCLHITCLQEDADHFLPAEDILDYTLQYTNCFTMIPAADAA